MRLRLAGVPLVLAASLLLAACGNTQPPPEAPSSAASSAAGQVSSEAAATMAAEAPAMMAAEAPAMMAAEAPAMMAAEAPASAGALPDDVVAAAAGDTRPGYGYVGVWAAEAATCASIADPGSAKFAVITDATFRDGERAYFGSFAPMTDNKLSLTVRAAAGTRTINLELAGPDSLSVDGTALLRCVL